MKDRKFPKEKCKEISQGVMQESFPELEDTERLDWKSPLNVSITHRNISTRSYTPDISEHRNREAIWKAFRKTKHIV